MNAIADRSGSTGNDFAPVLGSFSSSAELSSTIEWTGIVDVTHGGGSPAASCEAENDIGIDNATAGRVNRPVRTSLDRYLRFAVGDLRSAGLSSVRDRSIHAHASGALRVSGSHPALSVWAHHPGPVH
jgi:hypothetical protein